MLSSTNVYADIVHEIGGESVQSSSIITSAAQDPHSYEATARDKLAMSNAQLVIGNGGGYDSFMDQLAQDLKLSPDTFLRAMEHAELSSEADDAAPHAEHADEAAGHADEHDHEHGGTNEHIWYHLDSMKHVAEEIADRLSTLSPEHRQEFTANTAALVKKLDALDTRIHDLESKSTGLHFAMTEPLALHLLNDLGMHDSTPAGFSEAIEAGTDASPRAVKEFTTLLESGKIDVLAYNPQTETPQTQRLKELAHARNIPVVDFLETLPPGSSYTQWMNKNLDAIEAILH